MKARSFRLIAVLTACCCLLTISANASYIVSGGTKTGATSSFYASADYDIYGYIEYDYFGVDTTSSYDYVIDLVSMSSYVTNRGGNLDGTWYRADCNTNYGDTCGSFYYYAESVPSGASWQHNSVDWASFASLNGRDTYFRFNENETVFFSIGVFVNSSNPWCIGSLNTWWSSSGRTYSWDYA